MKKSILSFGLFSLILSFTAAAALLTAQAHGADSNANSEAASDSEAKPRQRQFRLTYAATVSDLDSDKKVRVWLPVPQSSAAQDVGIAAMQLPTNKSRRTWGKRYGNEFLYFEHTPDDGKFSFKIEYDVTRREVHGLQQPAGQSLTEQEQSLFLAANDRVPITGKPLQLLPNFGGVTSEIMQARMLYDRVDDHVKYDKSKPGYGNGDVVWVCDSQFGNCTDFHSLFISLARSQQIPARFEIGFPLPTERGDGQIGGYHCWASFHAKEHGWVPVDISEADKHPEMKKYYFGNLTENRISFSVGRDIQLEPKQAGPPLNYFVYPYIEVDGKPLGKKQITLDFKYKDRYPE